MSYQQEIENLVEERKQNRDSSGISEVELSDLYQDYCQTNPAGISCRLYELAEDFEFVSEVSEFLYEGVNSTMVTMIADRMKELIKNDIEDDFCKLGGGNE